MLLGFVVIAGTLYYIGYVPAPTNAQNQVAFQEKITVGVLGAIVGILTNFIGAMYIKMFAEIVQTVNRSFSALLATHHYNFANVLAANIRNDALREKTLSDLALAMKATAPQIPG